MVGRIKVTNKNRMPKIERLIDLSKKLKEEFGDKNNRRDSFRFVC